MDIKDYAQMMKYLTRPASSMVPGPRNMAYGGQVVIGKPGGLVQPGTKFYAIKKTIKGTGDNAGNFTTYVGGRDNQIKYIGSKDYIDKIRRDFPKFGLVGKTVKQKEADKAAVNKKAIIKNFKDNLGIDIEIGKNNLITGENLTQELKDKINIAQKRARRRNPGQGSLKDPKFWEFYNKYYKDIEDKKIADAEKEAARIKATSPDFIKELDRPLTKKEKMILNKSYDNIFLEEFNRLKNEGDLFSKTDLNRAVINRIVDENPTIDIASGKGLDKVFHGDENNKSMHERTDGGKTSLLSKQDMKSFTTNTNALNYTKSQDRLLQALLNGFTDFDDLMVELDFNEGRLNGNLNKLMRNLAYSDESKKPLFFKKYTEQDLEKAQNVVFESPTLESTYQRTALQSIYESTKRGSPEQKQALEKLKEFNKFKKVMEDNGLSGKLVSLDHAASYRALKNGNIKNFLAMTPIMSDINAVKSTFDRRSQLNLRRMQEAIANGDNVAYKKFLKNQTELEGIWKTMTGDQSSLGKIRIGATGAKKGIVKITDYGATSILDKNKKLLNELNNNLVIRENIVKASTKGNLDEVSRIMFEGSTAEKPRASKLPESFKRLNKPEMFAAEKQIKELLKQFEARGCKGKAAGGRILFSNGGEAITGCAQKGVARFIDDLKKGNYSKATMNILKGGGNVIKNILNPMELLKLRNYFGPAALGFMAMFEAGVITDDVIRQGTPLNESLANNWLTKAFLPYTKDYAQAKNLLETGNVPSNMKKYVKDVITFNETLMDIKGIENRKQSRLVDDTGLGMIDGTSMYTKEQEQKDQENLFKKLSTIEENVFTPGTAKELEYKKMLDEMKATRMAKKEFSPLFGYDNLKDRNQTTVFDEYISPVDTPKDLRPITYMDAEYEDVKTLPASERQMYENYFTKKGILQPRQSLSELMYDADTTLYDEILKDYNAFQRQKEASKYQGYHGTQEPDRFMEGGIASLNVKK